MGSGPPLPRWIRLRGPPGFRLSRPVAVTRNSVRVDHYAGHSLSDQGGQALVDRFELVTDRKSGRRLAHREGSGTEKRNKALLERPPGATGERQDLTRACPSGERHWLISTSGKSISMSASSCDSITKYVAATTAATRARSQIRERVFMG